MARTSPYTKFLQLLNVKPAGDQLTDQEQRSAGCLSPPCCKGVEMLSQATDCLCTQ